MDLSIIVAFGSLMVSAVSVWFSLKALGQSQRDIQYTDKRDTARKMLILVKDFQKQLKGATSAGTAGSKDEDVKDIRVQMLQIPWDTYRAIVQHHTLVQVDLKESFDNEIHELSTILRILRASITMIFDPKLESYKRFGSITEDKSEELHNNIYGGEAIHEKIEPIIETFEKRLERHL